jgi:hypothetical protein
MHNVCFVREWIVFCATVKALPQFLLILSANAQELSIENWNYEFTQTLQELSSITGTMSPERPQKDGKTKHFFSKQVGS